MTKTETFEDAKSFWQAAGRAKRASDRARRKQPKVRAALVRERGERQRRTKLSMARAQELGWQLGFVQGRGHYAWQSDGRRVGYETDVPALLDSLWEAGER